MTKKATKAKTVKSATKENGIRVSFSYNSKHPVSAEFSSMFEVVNDMVGGSLTAFECYENRGGF